MADWSTPYLGWMRPPWMPAGVIANPFDHPRRWAFEIGRVTADGGARAVSERFEPLSPFAELSRFTIERDAPAPKALLVMPMSGHYGVVTRDLVAALLPTADVAVLDWPSARFAPISAGRFGFDGQIASVCDALARLGPGAHLVGLCQGAPPAAAAAALLHQEGAPTRPASLALMGGPMDPDAAPTRLAKLLKSLPLDFIASVGLATVPDGLPGAGRRVYPATAQLRGLLTHLGRQWAAGGPLYRKLMANDGLDPERFPFLTVYTRVRDIEGAAFLESIETIFHANRLAQGALAWRGVRVRPEAASELALFTIEAAEDQIAAPGQTAAAHRIFAAARAAGPRRLVLESGGHFDLFHGPSARGIVAPALTRFFAAAAALKLGSER